jgi:hypothetical protein
MTGREQEQAHDGRRDVRRELEGVNLMVKGADGRPISSWKSSRPNPEITRDARYDTGSGDEIRGEAPR